MVMEICKNKATGKAFVVLDQAQAGEVLLVTPKGEIKPLERRLFSGRIEVSDGRALVSQKVITQKQFDAFRKYHQD